MVFETNNPFASPRPSFPQKIVAPDVEPDDTGASVCVTFNAAWHPVVIGALQALMLPATWQGDETTVGIAQDRAALLVDMFGNAINEDGCMSFQLRQNAENTCLLEQSLDGGVTWSTAFDYNQCVPLAMQAVLSLVNANNTAESPFMPDATFTLSTGDDAAAALARSKAFCYAVTAVTEGLMNACVQVIERQATGNSLGAIVLGVVAAVIGIANVFAAGTLTAFFLAAVAAALAAAAEVEGIIAAKYQDQDNIDAMVCLMLGNLQNVAVTLENFQQAYTGADCLTADQQAIASVLTTMLQNPAYAQEIFDQFNNINGEAYQAALGGLVNPTCLCSGDTWCFDIKPSTWEGWEYVDRWHQNECAVPTAAHGTLNGTVSNDAWVAAVSGGFSGVSLAILVNLPEGTAITSANMYYSNAGTGDWSIKECAVNTTRHCGSTFTPSPVGVSVSAEGLATIYAIIDTKAGYPTVNSLKINSIRVRGTGRNPFAPCDNCT